MRKRRVFSRVPKKAVALAASAVMVTGALLTVSPTLAQADATEVLQLPCPGGALSSGATSWTASDYTTNVFATKPNTGAYPAGWPWTPPGVSNLPQSAYSGYSLYNTIRATGAQSSYYANNKFGEGIGVALIDSGVAPVSGLDSGNVIQGPDLSFEAQSGYAHNDTYGHGTAMASIIAGRDSAAAPYGYADAMSFTGIAPGAKVISLKVADTTGAVDVTQVIAAIDWVVQHRNDPGLNIRVLNLSYGVQALDSTNVDRLTTAVEAAWKNGIVVVVADGNNGANTLGVKADAGLNFPAAAKSVIAVGSYDDGGNFNTWVDDTIPNYSSSSSSSNKRNPDIMAPGQHVLALHDLGASMDDEIAQDCANAVSPGVEAIAPGLWNAIQPIVATSTPAQWAGIPILSTPWKSPITGPNDRFVRGSGTSEAAALTSGAVALMLSKNPSLTNNQVKDILMRSAWNAWGSAAGAQYRGAGELRLDSAYGMTSTATQTYQLPDGSGTFDDARGVYTPPPSTYIEGTLPANLVAANGIALKGNNDIFGNPISASLYSNEVYGVAWRSWGLSGGAQYEAWVGDPALKLGTGFVSDPVFGHVWASYAWPATDWAGQSFTTIDNAADPLTGHTWRGNRWSGNRWSTDSLQGNRWSGNRWSTSALQGNRWSGNSWRDASWG
jgi:serine protease AprX